MIKYLEGVPSLTNRQWHLNQIDERQALMLAQRYNLPLIIASLLLSRGIDDKTIESFLTPSLKRLLPNPSEFKDLDKAIDRIVQAITIKEKIAVYGDYDVDGATSSALLNRYLSRVGGDVIVYIPDRHKEGYGPHTLAFQKLKDQNVKLIITVDCGTNSFEPLTAAKNMGLDVIVIDHHIPEMRLPPALAFVNPNRLDESGQWGYLAAVGVCFLIVVALNRALRRKGFFKIYSEPNLLEYLDLVALGTVCDVMALRGLNRAFVAQGLKVLAKRQNIGLKALMDTAGVAEAPSAYHLGFILGPRINAGGRVGEADLGTQLLTTEDSFKAHKIAQHLNILNLERQDIESEILKKAFLQAESQTRPLILVYGQNWHIGVIGIVAGRLKERFNRPALVISIDEKGIGKGSGRSIGGVDLGALILAAKQKEYLLTGGGHAMAVGFSIESSRIQELDQFLNKCLLNLSYDLIPTIHIDSHLTLTGATFSFAKLLEKISPFGQGNPTPRFIIENLQVLKVNIVGKDHIRCILKDEEGKTLSAMAFRSIGTPLGEAFLKSKGEWFHIIGTLKVDSWLGEERMQFTIEDAMLRTTSRGHSTY